jgi:hypothetical protein
MILSTDAESPVDLDHDSLSDTLPRRDGRRSVVAWKFVVKVLDLTSDLDCCLMPVPGRCSQNESVLSVLSCLLSRCAVVSVARLPAGSCCCLCVVGTKVVVNNVLRDLELLIFL